MKSEGRSGIAELYATILIITITLSLAYTISSHIKPTSSAGRLTFLNSSSLLGGSTSILLVRVNTSMQAELKSMQIDGYSSMNGLFAFNGSHYSVTSTLCRQDLITFFSVYAPSGGELRVQTDGKSWISGYWASSISVTEGWHEIIIANGSSCSITLPDGEQIASLNGASPLPVNGQLNSTYFEFFIPSRGSGHELLLIFQGGLDRIAI